MDLNELKGLPPEQAIEKAAAWAGVRPEILDGIWRTETGRGTHPTMVGPETKWGTAKGHFQQLDSMVQVWRQRTGKELDPFDFADGLYMAAHQMRENIKRYGNEEQAVMAYHGGTNQKNWGKNTQDYLRKVTGLQDVGVPKITSGGAKVAPGALELPATLEEQIAQIGPVDRTTAVPTAPVVPPPVLERDPSAAPVTTVQSEGTFLGDVATAAEAAYAPAPDFSWADKQDAAYENSMEPWFNLARTLGDGGPERDPKWMRWAAENDADVYKDFPLESDREFLREAVSAQDLEARKARLAERKANEKVTGADGPWAELGHSVLADLRNPASWTADLVATAGLSKIARIGSMTATAARRAAIPLTMAESVAGSLTMDAMLTMAGEYRSSNDVVSGAVASAGLGALFSVPAYREASRRELEEFERKAINDAVNGKLDTLQQAVDELGAGADPVEVGRRASVIEAGKLKEEHSAALTAAPEGDRIPAAEPVPVEEVLESADLSPQGRSLRDRIEAAQPGDAEKVYAPFEDPAYLQRRKDAWATNTQWQADARARAPDFDELPTGVHISRTATPEVKAAADSIIPILQKYLPPEAKVVFGTETKRTDADGIVTSAGDVHVIGLTQRPGAPSEMLHTAAHEAGHVVFHQWAKDIPAPILDRVNQDWMAFVGRLRRGDPDAVNDRFAPTSPSRAANVGDSLPRTNYVASRDEWLAEQWVKHVQTEAAKGTYGDVPQGIIDKLVNAVKRVVQYVLDVTRQGKLAPEAGPQEMFTWIMANASGARKASEEFLAPELRLPDLEAASMPVGGFKGPAMLSPPMPRIMGADFAFAQKYGLDLMPQNTPLERAEFKAVMDIYRKAEAWVAKNPRLDERARTLLNKSAMFQVTGTALAGSDNPVARMVAGTLLESTTGAQGRRATAAIAADMHNRRFLGNTIGEYTTAYDQWAKLNGGNLMDEFKGTTRERFDRAVALEISNRALGRTSGDALVVRAADILEKAYERMRAAQVTTGTVGHAMLPDSAKGYMPRVLNKGKVINMTDAELRAFADIMSEQFQTLEGFDKKFSDELARKYVDHARINANGGHEIPANIHQPGAADMVRKALEDMGIGREALVEMMQRFSRGGPSYTKHRLNLDLTKDYNGVKLLDLYDTDQLNLLRRYSRRVSGEVALAQFGVMGSQGLRLLRRAMEFGPDANKPELREAFDQIAAEFLGQPFGNASGKWMDRAMQVNSLARMGGMGITQAGEMVNAVWHIGVLQSLATIPSLPRLRREILALSRGEKVDNPILTSIEQYGGAGEFGMDGYRMVLPYDDLGNAYHTYGKDTVTALDKVLRAGNYTQGILSGWRAIHGVQQRAVAEQITLKAIRYMRDDLESVALTDMGFTKSFQRKFKKDLPNMVTYDAGGRVQSFDLTKASDPAIAAEFAQAVLRGTNQIIQGQFIGETGKWAHEGWLKMFTQFRTFPLVAMEKQWARQRANHGYLTAIGMMAGSIAAVSPLIMARVYLSSLGRPDAEEYLEERLQPAHIARMALNYVALSGLSGDLLDALSAVAPDDWGLQQAGARSGGAQGAIGNIAAPALGYVDDAYKALQDADNPHKWLQLAPFSRLPYLVPLVNLTRKE